MKNSDKNTNPNSNVAADEYREWLMKDYEEEKDVTAQSIEQDWRRLERQYEVIKREDHPASSPMRSFMYYVDLAFYPPPEILFCIEKCFRNYWDAGGDISLDEAFFGKKHKKSTSPAYIEKKLYEYFLFSVFYDGPMSPPGSEKKSLEQKVEDLFNDRYFAPEKEVDVDSFLRGYRRWKKKFTTQDKK
jgi:hypothetical protein